MALKLLSRSRAKGGPGDQHSALAGRVALLQPWEDWHDVTDRVLNGKVALVTGAAGEIGTATIQLLAERGARIVAVDRDDAGLARAIGTLPASAEALSVSRTSASKRTLRLRAHLFQQRRHRGRHQTDSGLSARDVSPGARPTSHQT